MKIQRPTALSKQAGNLLVSMTIGLGILSLMQIGFGMEMVARTQRSNGEILGKQMSSLVGVMDEYTTKYNTELQKPSPVIAGIVNPLAPTIAELANLGMTATSTTQDPYRGGKFLTEVSLAPVGCTAPACNVRSKVWLRDPILDLESQVIDLPILGAAVAATTHGVSFSLPDTPSIIKSAAGWTETNPDPANRAGILVGISGHNDSGLSVYLRRDGTQPVTADFPMTGLDGVEHSITGAKDITATGMTRSKDVTATGLTRSKYLLPDALVTSGTSCNSGGDIIESGTMARDATTGSVVICKAGLWSGLGSDNRKMMNMGGVRGNGGIYTNDTDHTIQVILTGRTVQYTTPWFYNSGQIISQPTDSTDFALVHAFTMDVPAGETYGAYYTAGIYSWFELR